jgi:hypothetical protein
MAGKNEDETDKTSINEHNQQRFTISGYFGWKFSGCPSLVSLVEWDSNNHFGASPRLDPPENFERFPGRDSRASSPNAYTFGVGFPHLC